MTCPVLVEELSTQLVFALESVRTEIIALCLHKIGGQIGRCERIEIVQRRRESRNRQFKNSLTHLYPAKLIPVIIKRSGIDPDKKVNEITKEERSGLVRTTKELEFTLTGLRDYKEAIITQGGIRVKEVDPSTMASKLVKGLYFAGEILDLDAVTGGYNLQIAWSTAYLAGRSAAEAITE